MIRLFYIIYNSYYKHGEYKDDIPTLTVGGIFSVSFYCIELSIINIIGFINPLYQKMKISGFKSFLISIISLVIVYFLFYHKKRYDKIYERYKDDIFLNSKTAKYFGFIIIVLIILSPFLLAMLQNKILHGYWV